MFKSFFKPSWAHRNPDKRLRALVKLSAENADDHAVLANLAVNDHDPRVRLKAVEKLCDLNLIADIIQDEPDEIVATCAQNRYYALISGTAAESTREIISGRYRIVDESDDEELKKFVIHHSPDTKLQFIALQGLVSVEDIGRIAITAPNVKIREAAARMADQMANKVEEQKIPSDKPASNDESAAGSIADLQRQREEQNKPPLDPEKEARKKEVLQDLKLVKHSGSKDSAQFIATGDSLQIDEDSAADLQALLDQKLAQRSKKASQPPSPK
jgi:hypothetical protein